MFFSKMHGLKNDFMVIDCITQNINNLSHQLIKKWSNRYSGIGFDQLLLVEKSNSPIIDFHYRIFNSDGNEVKQCGNGARCFAYFVLIKKLTYKRKIFVSTYTRTMSLEVIKDKVVKVNIGVPEFNPVSIPSLFTKTQLTYSLLIQKKIFKFGMVSLGNPHCTIIVKKIYNYPVKSIGKLISHHIFFPEGVNVGFMEIINKENIHLRVFERGVGETKSCGSGACAAVVIGILQKILNNNVIVKLTGGTLQISWKGPGYPIYMIGPVSHVYDGYIII
ncbi:diaminopimelate epimerase [Buchnera aphidicola (Formosaphis micheliae)]|uniref:diaminopimelate epimerase n=1 Tax=Buchnera aphidicola TaxID=9 RepID=UPI0031B85730